MEPVPLPRLLVPVLLLEGSLVVAALLLGHFWLGAWFPMRVVPAGADVLWALGAASALTLLAAAATSTRARRVAWLESIHARVVSLLGRAIAAESVPALVGVSLAAGVGEELLFRGVLQPGWGLGASAFVFGLAHAVTPAYFGLALGMGLLLGWLAQASGGLFAPIVAHAAYDLVALLRLRARLRQEEHSPQPE